MHKMVEAGPREAARAIRSQDFAGDLVRQAGSPPASSSARGRWPGVGNGSAGDADLFRHILIWWLAVEP